ncbi:MAG: diguanylate cyclase [Gammaproteobacteria bacterium]|nr:diguanylate cyclase [Gammaproteobacteria bacterium]
MIAKILSAGSFFSIRKKILLFAAFATLAPSSLLGWVAYYKTHDILEAKATQELQVELSRVEREINTWIDERFNDLRVFSSSFALSRNLALQNESLASAQTGDTDPALSAESQINEFLKLIQAQVKDYRRLLVLDLAGKPTAQHPLLENGVMLGPEWSDQLRVDRMTISHHHSNTPISSQLIILAVPIVDISKADIGLLAAEIPVTRLSKLLENSNSGSLEMLLVTGGGEILLSSHPLAAATDNELTVKQTALQPDSTLIDYRNHRSRKVVSLSLELPRLPWHLVIQKNYKDVFTEIEDLRQFSLLLTLALLAGFGVLAYLVSQSILRPLKRLTLAASAVAEGNLEVSLDDIKGDELGLAMKVFNNMVERLRQNRDELKRISVTDSLTGLYNRKYLMQALHQHFGRYRRNGPCFSVLMIDIDHFKGINDKYGHQAGDTALEELGQIFQSILRNIDIAGRYGGEEFLIILEQASHQQALETAERIRSVAEKSSVAFNKAEICFTLSVGTATVNQDPNDTPEQLISRADSMLYIAKNQGRNRVMAFEQHQPAGKSAD